MSLASLGSQVGSGMDAIGAAGELAGAATGTGFAASAATAAFEPELAAQDRKQTAENKQVLERILYISCFNPGGVG
jgi:hypothetical protein